MKKNCILDVYDKHYGFLNNQKCAKQRARKGYCERDVDEINTWFLCIIPEMLDELNKKRNNYPTTLLAEFYQKNKDRIVGTEKEFSLGQNEANKVIYEEAATWCEKRWNEILTRMMFLFSESRNDENHDYREKCLNEGFALFVKYFDDLWW